MTLFKRRKLRKALAIALSSILVMSSSTFHVFGDTSLATATDSNATVSITIGEGTLTDPEVTTTTTTVTDKESGTTTITTDISTSAVGTNENGATVDYQNKENTSTVTDSENRITSISGKESGSETISETSTTVNTEEINCPEQDSTKTQTGETITTETPGTFETTDVTAETTTTEEIDPGYAGDVSVTLTPGETKTASATVNEAQLASENLSTPSSYTEETTNAATGEKTIKEVTVTEIHDANGNVIGYTTTTTVTTETPTSETTSEQIGDAAVTSETGETVTDTTVNTVINLPEKPEAGETTDAVTGAKTTVTVEELLNENGEIVGYQSTIVVIDAAGNEISTGTESVWGTITTTTTTETTPTTTTTSTNHKITTTTTTAITEATTVSGQKIVATDRQVTATMSQITASGTHGHVTTYSLVPDLSIQPADGEVRYDLHNPYDTIVSGSFGDYDFMYQGEYGLESAIRVKKNSTSANNTTVHEFVLIDKSGNKHYVFCADLGTNAQLGYRYDMVNVEAADYYSDEDAKIITSIALNGYWGTSEGIGSLETVKDSLTQARNEALKNNQSFPLTQDQINNLTPGQALTATQAAIWYYGNSNESNRMDSTSIAGVNYAGANANWYYHDESDKSAVNGLYQYLINLPATQNDSTTQFITEENFATEATILVGELAADENGNLLAVNTDADTSNDVYNTDVTFSLSITPSLVNDDLIVRVYDSNNNLITTKRLAGDDSLTNFGKIAQNKDEDGNDNGTYTITGLQLAENLTITLNLSGTQHLDTGVYLYSSEVRGTTSSQTFVGIASGKRDVNLNVSLSFRVDEATAAIESTSSGTTREKTDTSEETRTDTVSESTVKASVVITTEVTEETAKEWENTWSQSYQYSDPDDPDDPDTPVQPRDVDSPSTPDKPSKDDDDPGTTTPETGTPTTEVPTAVLSETERITDDPVPLATLPKTGDASVLWLVFASLSGLGLAGLSFSDKKRRK